MAKQIIINPLTRISGFMEIEATIENNGIVEGKTKGFIFRGFEKMLKGRNPFDAVYFTERICGICSTAHAIASTLALEGAVGIIPSEQGRYLCDILIYIYIFAVYLSVAKPNRSASAVHEKG